MQTKKSWFGKVSVFWNVNEKGNKKRRKWKNKKKTVFSPNICRRFVDGVSSKTPRDINQLIKSKLNRAHKSEHSISSMGIPYLKKTFS